MKTQQSFCGFQNKIQQNRENVSYSYASTASWPQNVSLSSSPPINHVMFDPSINFASYICRHPATLSVYIYINGLFTPARRHSIAQNYTAFVRVPQRVLLSACCIHECLGQPTWARDIRSLSRPAWLVVASAQHTSSIGMRGIREDVKHANEYPATAHISLLKFRCEARIWWLGSLATRRRNSPASWPTVVCMCDRHYIMALIHELRLVSTPWWAGS